MIAGLLATLSSVDFKGFRDRLVVDCLYLHVATLVALIRRGDGVVLNTFD